MHKDTVEPFDSDGLTATKNSDKQLSLSLEFAIEIAPIVTYTGVVFSFKERGSSATFRAPLVSKSDL